MLEYLTDLVMRLGQWGYVVIFAVATAESAAFLGLLVPGESLVIIAGILAGQGLLDLDALIVTVAIGAAVGDSLGYEFGRRLGRGWATRYGGRLGVTEDRLKRAEAFFSRHGGKAVFFGRFVGFARALVPFIAGSARMRYLVFLPFNLVGAGLWAAIVVLLGYFVGQVAHQWAGKASAILGVVALAAFAVAWLWRWLARHETDVKNRWARIAKHPWIAFVLRRVSPYTVWLRARLSPGGYFGLEMTLGILAFTGAAWLLGGVTEDVVSGDPLTLFDLRAERWFYAHQVPWLTSVMSAVSRWHEWRPVSIATFVLALFLVWRRQWYWLVAVACAIPGGTALNTLLKLVLHRARPNLTELAATLRTYSFPSGHTVAATLFYGFIAVYLASLVSAWRWRVLAVLGAMLMVFFVALSRVYLGVHYVSDVLAAMAEGIAWLALCLIALSTMWRRPRHAATP